MAAQERVAPPKITPTEVDEELARTQAALAEALGEIRATLRKVAQENREEIRDLRVPAGGRQMFPL